MTIRSDSRILHSRFQFFFDVKITYSKHDITMIYMYNLYRICGVESISQMISKYQRQTGQIFCDASLVSILPEGVITIPLLDVWEELDFTKEQNKTKNN